MKETRRGALLTAAAVVAAVASTGAQQRPMDMVQGNSAFTTELYRQIASGEGNRFASPFSVRMALAMTWAGARGDTAAEMAHGLHLGPDVQAVHQGFATLQQRLRPPEGSPYELALANRLFAQRGFQFLPDFFALLRDRYQAPLEEVSFKPDPEPARRHINQWVEQATRDKIKELLAPGKVKPDMRLVLVNAIYFKGTWESPFDEDATSAVPFRSGGGAFDVPTMSRKLHAGYAERDGLQVLRLPYKGGELSMLVLLPREDQGMGRLEEALSARKLEEWTRDLPAMEVRVFLPRWKFSWGGDLNSSLQALGMRKAFDCAPPVPQADFSGMTGRRDLCLDFVVHKAFVEVNERGTEAAASTAAGMMEITAVRPEPKVFRADHPFLFLIRHEPTGAVLFIGRVVDPRAQ